MKCFMVTSFTFVIVCKASMSSNFSTIARSLEEYSSTCFYIELNKKLLAKVLVLVLTSCFCILSALNPIYIFNLKCIRETNKHCKNVFKILRWLFRKNVKQKNIIEKFTYVTKVHPSIYLL